EVGERLADQGIGATVVDPRWVLPVSDDLLDLARAHDLVVTVEDGLAQNGVGSAIRDALARRGQHIPVQAHGIPLQFLDHAARDELVTDLGLRAQDVALQAASAAVDLADYGEVARGGFGRNGTGRHQLSTEEVPRAPLDR